MPKRIPDNVAQKLRAISKQHDEFATQLLSPEVLSDHRQVKSISIKKAAIEPLVELFNEYELATIQECELQELENNDDIEIAALAKEELKQTKNLIASLAVNIEKQLVNSEDQAVGSIILEIRAGVGGDEAAIWAGDLEEMYKRYALERGWAVDCMDNSHADMGGCKSVILSIGGEGVWASLGFESGTHQVKRVPATETQGRVHTSTATVAVLPEPEAVEIEINPADVQERITTATGPGGQNVNKVATAVHLIHEPSGIEVRMQDTKSQAQNREKAWKLLRARLFEKQKAEIDAKRAEARQTLIGSGSRAEKIRTYRYKDNQVVDHRINASFGLSDFLSGQLQPAIDLLIEAETANRLANL